METLPEGVATEEEMRAAAAPWPKTADELAAYVQSLVTRPHDYGTCVYAMSMAAVAAYQFVAGELGVTGFQASCADLDILRRNRSLDCPFMLVKGDDLLYPQYDILAAVRKWMAECRGWAATEARRKMAENDGGDVHPGVWARWESLADYTDPEPEQEQEAA